ncbi:hypothetical protein COO60DRAFT_1108066 [Scenedesmus sp. NREL 46B-D3]|nr:hypothetical protein COO60DRAFT_1108066 [Scenedesmus sp. NREL 46B-D3]
MCGINGLPISEPRDEDFAEALLALSGVPEEPVDDVETTYQVDPSQQVDDRFYCPFPGCRRSFAELWRLKVHYRAPPNVRGSGKERGHGMRLDHCPKCNAVLKIGGHHVRCSAREAARQLAKKPRRTGPASAGEPKGAAAQKQQQQQQAEEAGSDSFPDSGYTSTTTPGPYMPANLPHAYMEQHQQQQALSYSFWEQQQPQQQQQQQQEEQPRLQVPALPEVQQLQRLQQLLNRVDQHLGFDFDPAEPAAAAALSCDHAAVHEPAAGYGEGAGCGGAAAAAAAAGYQPSVYHQQLLASLTGVAPAGYGGPAAAAASSSR